MLAKALGSFSGSARSSLWSCLLATVLILLFIGGHGSPAGKGLLVSPSHASVLAKGRASLPYRGQIRVGGTVVIDSVAGALWTCGFNPFVSTTNSVSEGVIYEPLVYVNPLTGKTSPLLATSYTWGSQKTTLTFVVRRGVRWSDGKPFTAADVAFTFNLMRKYPALDLQAVWSVLSGVTSQRNNVVMTFKRPSIPYFYFIADQVGIVAQHMWAKIQNPAAYPDRHPVGTGPFLVNQCTPRSIVYTRNSRYWQPRKPYVSRVTYPAFKDNGSGNLFLVQGKANWGCQFIPNVQSTYVNKDPAHRHYWYPPGSNVDLYLNQNVYPLTLLPVRQALSYAIDRGRISRNGVYGYLPPANQNGVVLPTFAGWYDRSLAAKYDYRYNPQRALTLLAKAGFKRGQDGFLWNKAGKKLSLSVINVGTFADWVAELRIMRNNLRQVGIDLTIENLSSNAYSAREQSGRFQLAYGSTVGGPNPYYELNSVLHSANSAPIGQTASSNYERWKDKTTDRLLDTFAASSDSAQQHTMLNQLQGIMLQNVPVIPVLESVTWYQYDNSTLTGWPTPSNPYASPGPCATPDWEIVLLNLHLK